MRYCSKNFGWPSTLTTMRAASEEFSVVPIPRMLNASPSWRSLPTRVTPGTLSNNSPMVVACAWSMSAWLTTVTACGVSIATLGAPPSPMTIRSSKVMLLVLTSVAVVVVCAATPCSAIAPSATPPSNAVARDLISPISSSRNIV